MLAASQTIRHARPYLGLCGKHLQRGRWLSCAFELPDDRLEHVGVTRVRADRSGALGDIERVIMGELRVEDLQISLRGICSSAGSSCDSRL